MRSLPKKDHGSLLIAAFVILLALAVYYVTVMNPCLIPNAPWHPSAKACMTIGTAFWTGTFSIVYSPCPVNMQCTPQYLLQGDDGNQYQLIFSAELSLPVQGQHIAIAGTFTANTQGSCELNGQAVTCQPMGTIQVRNW
jgi:hypothetical protein